jgi:UDP-N-acetylglucosamine acyltransferase
MAHREGVHPTAIVDPRVKLAEGATVGAYAVIKGAVSIGAGSAILEHCVLDGPTEIGRGCRIGPAAYVGLGPQHLRYTPDEANPSWLVIGNNVIIREGARIHRATHPGREHATRIGDNCFLMGAIHVAHDCVLENDVIMADGALLGGHCHIAARTFLGGGCTLHQFVPVGRLAIIAGNEAVGHGVPPFAAVRYGRLKGYNAVGCRRAGMGREAIVAIRAAYQRLRDHRTTGAAVAAIRSEVPDLPEVREILDFIASSNRGLLPSSRPSRTGQGTERADDDASTE